MKVKKYEDGLQIEVEAGPDVLVTVARHPDYGFKGSVITKKSTGEMTMVEFHGDGLDGVVVHDAVPYTE